MQFSLYDTIESHIRDFAADLYTATPAVVEKYNPEEQTVDVLPVIYKKNKDGVLIKEQILERVPIHFPSTSEVSITFPIKQGDKVLLVFCHSDTEDWLSSEEEFSSPKTRRKHNINDAMAFVGFNKYGESSVPSGREKDLHIRYKDSHITIQEGGNIEGRTTGTFSMSNDTGELVDWLSQLTDLVSQITVNTMYGVTPINNKPDVIELKSKIDTMKE